jgi:hypothetical protein
MRTILLVKISKNNSIIDYPKAYNSYTDIGNVFYSDVYISNKLGVMIVLKLQDE